MLSEQDRFPGLARVQLGGELLGQLARDPAELLPVREHLNGVGIVLVVRIAPQLKPAAGLDDGGSEGVRVVLAGPGYADDVQPALARGLPPEIPPAVGIDDLEPDDPDLPTVVRIPVVLVVLDVDYHPAKASKGSAP
ncbi:MAG TPA: hypothetical protein VHR40_00970 [Thermoleophilaceae bacterium]|nr:hypothetical protein [Thermoleophilaceae bacterium]